MQTKTFFINHPLKDGFLFKQEKIFTTGEFKVLKCKQ